MHDGQMAAMHGVERAAEETDAHVWLASDKPLRLAALLRRQGCADKSSRAHCAG